MCSSDLELKGNVILDFGCGSGRDSKYFQDLGYLVTALDGSKELALLAEKLLNKTVTVKDFRDFNDVEQYDGMWASASLLHLNQGDLIKVLKSLRYALKKEGILYTCFKEGQGEEIDALGRYYLYNTAEDYCELVGKDFNIIECYTTN